MTGEPRDFRVNNGIVGGDGAIHVTGSALGIGNTVHNLTGSSGDEIAHLLYEVRALVRENRGALAEPAAVEQQVETVANHLGRDDPDGGYLLYLLGGVSRALEAAGVAVAPVAALATAISTML